MRNSVLISSRDVLSMTHTLAFSTASYHDVYLSPLLNIRDERRKSDTLNERPSIPWETRKSLCLKEASQPPRRPTPNGVTYEQEFLPHDSHKLSKNYIQVTAMSPQRVSNKTKPTGLPLLGYNKFPIKPSPAFLYSRRGGRPVVLSLYRPPHPSCCTVGHPQIRDVTSDSYMTSLFRDAVFPRKTVACWERVMPRGRQ